MNLPCEIVMDLVALYQDGLANPVTKNSVAAHLRTCPDCRRYYKQYRRFSQNLPIWDRSLQKMQLNRSFADWRKKCAIEGCSLVLDFSPMSVLPGVCW